MVEAPLAIPLISAVGGEGTAIVERVVPLAYLRVPMPATPSLAMPATRRKIAVALASVHTAFATGMPAR